MRQSLFGQHRRYPVGAFVAKRRIEQGELLDLVELLQQLFDGETGPAALRLSMDMLEQGDAEHAVEGMHADLAVGPVIHRSPGQPLTVLESAKHALDLLLTRVTGDYLLSAPVQTVGEQHGAAEPLRPELFERAVVDVES